MRIVNWTKHDINIYDENKQFVVTVKPSGLEARIKSDVRKVSEIDNVPLFHTVPNGPPYLINTNGEISEIPDIEGNTIYIVSSIFRSHYDRPDLYQPGYLLRDERGNAIGCVGLSR